MKRKLALFMVLAMLISLVPMNVFAASTNTVLSAASVSKDSTTTSSLRILESSSGEWLNTTRSFEVQLTNAEFKPTMTTAFAAMTLTGADRTGAVTTATFKVTKNTDTFATVIIKMPTKTSRSGKVFFDIALPVKATGGEVSLKIDPRDSQVSAGTYVIANGVDGATATTIASVKTFADAIVLDTVKIDEATIGSLDATVAQTVKLKLNSGFEFNGTTASLSSAGGWTTATNATGVALTPDASDARIVTFIVTPGTVAATQRGTMYIGGLKIKRTSDAKVGEVNMTVSSTAAAGQNTLTEQTVKVAEYATYDVTVKAAADPVTIYSGAYTTAASGDDSSQKLSKLIIKEEVQNSWLAQRITKIQFNDEVKIVGFKIRKADNITGGAIDIDGAANQTFTNALDTFRVTSLTNRNYIEITQASIATGQKANVELEFYVSVKGNYTGDITATVGGTALTKETKVVLGKAVAPATISVAAVKDLKLGLQNQMLADITITEPAKGVWGANANGTSNVIDVTFDDNIALNTKGSVSVTKGDVTLGTLTSTGNTVRIPVKYSSSVASEITLKGVTIDLLRNIPEGKFNVYAGGTSLVNNYSATEVMAKFNKSKCSEALAFNVITPADANTKAISNVVFTIGSAEYTVGGAAMTADAPAYINEQGRTMLPLRALSNALGVTDANIMWNDAEHSVTIFKGDATLKVIIGEMSFNKNGVNVPMDTNAIIVNSRTFLPLRAMGQALGAVITWDEATRTVTVN